jgi:integrase
MRKPNPAPTGVIIRDAHLQIDLRAQGFGRERLELAPTPANINHAARLRNDILGKIERGTFALAEYFPDSPRAKADNASMTWKELGAEWLKIKKGDIEHSTLHHYEQTLGSYHFADWDPLHLVDIDYRRLKGKLATLPANAKTFNNIASVLSMVLEYGHKAKLLKEALHEGIEMRRLAKPKPDPFSLAEIDLMLSKMRDPRGATFYEFAFFSGLRPSEQIALRWADLDLRAGTATVRRAITRSKEKGTKTGEERTVELNARARAAIERQRPVSQLAGGVVFLGVDGKPYTTTDGPLDAWWKPATKLAGLRQRDARQTRHSYATLCLHAGLKPGWVALQLGHSVEMFYRVYSRWIPDADVGTERRKLDAFMASSQPQPKENAA